ncbi:MAG: hypothetical protein RL653_364 [Pseudomonadota bacterium]|jgi:hypothetical protein
MTTGSPSRPPRLEPLGLGELIDRAVRHWRAHLKLYVPPVLGFQLVLYVLQKGYLFAMDRYFPLMRGGRALDDALSAGASEAVVRQLGLGFGAAAVLAVASLVLSQAASVAVQAEIWPRLLGNVPPEGTWKTRLRARAWTLTSTFTLAQLWLLGVLLLGSAPVAAGLMLTWQLSGDLSPLALVVGVGAEAVVVLLVLLWYVLRFLMVPTVLATEDRGAVETLRRAGELVQGRVAPGLLGLLPVRATVLLTTAFALLLGVGLVTSIPSLVVQGLFGNLFNPDAGPPGPWFQLLSVPADLVETAGSAVLSPLYFALFCYHYLDVRMRRDGLDLSARLTQLESRP